MLEADLFALFSDRVVERYGETYFDKETAYMFLDACEDNGFTILGVEGFWLSDSATLHDSDWIADYSQGGLQYSAMIRMARELINKAPLGMMFNFVIK